MDFFGFLLQTDLIGMMEIIFVFKNDPNDSTTIPNNNCCAITEDSDGFIWIGVSGNVIAKYNSIDETFKRYQIEKQEM